MSIDQLIGHIGKVLVVDDEQSNLTLVKNYLKQQNQYDVHTFREGEAAWHSLKSSTYTFVIMGWRIKDVSGIAFLNRLRRLPDTASLPVLVTSGMIDRNDFRLLGEFPCTKLLESPFTRGQFEKSIEILLREKLWYTSNEGTIQSLIESARGDGKNLEAQVKKILDSSPNPAPLAIVAARSMCIAGHYSEAKKVLSAVLLKNQSNISALNELAKIHCRQREYSKALDLMRHASDISPHNMQRICMLGEVSLSLRDPEGARKYFNEALEIDRIDEVATAGLALTKNLLEFPANAGGVALTASFASLLNTIGISFVRNGNYDKGIEQYQSAMMFIRDDIDIAKVAFNLGLCYMRWGKRSEALPWFEKSNHYAGNLLKKSGNYVLTLKNELNQKLKDTVSIPKKGPVPYREPKGYSFVEAAAARAAADEAARKQAEQKNKSGSKKSKVPPVRFDDDENLEEHLGPVKGGTISSESVEQLLNASLDEIENMSLEDLDEIA